MAAVEIGLSISADTLKLTFQRKLVRDSAGYYYAIWHNQSEEIFLVKSNSINGFDGLETPVEIVGSTGVAYTDNARFPSIVIDSNDVLHLTFVRRVEQEIFYVQWDTATAMNDSNNWKHADGSTNGAERLCTNNFGDSFYGSVDVDSDNYPHVVWSQVDANRELFYRRWTGAAWSAADTQITDGSAENQNYAGICIDGNDHAHIHWSNWQADTKIRYAHTHDFTNWFQSDDTTPITTGASGELIIQQGGMDVAFSSMDISKHAGTLNDIWVVAEERTAADIMYGWYDKSAGTWTVSQDRATGGACREATVGIDGRGHIYIIFERDNDIILSRSDDSGTSWKTTTLESAGAVESQAQIEANFDEDDYFGYLFWDSTNGRVYFNRSDTYYNLKKHPLIEQNQSIKRCQSNLGYFFQATVADKGYWDKLTVSALDPPKVNPMIEQNGTGDKIGYVFNQTCNQSEYFDMILIPAKGGGGGSVLIWLNLPGK